VGDFGLFFDIDVVGKSILKVQSVGGVVTIFEVFNEVHFSSVKRLWVSGISVDIRFGVKRFGQKGLELGSSDLNWGFHEHSDDSFLAGRG
jgi:hypothetical protein